jgi:aminobenzoyl-glutamate transport protein
MKNKLLARLACGLLLAELLLVLASWLLSALPVVEARSLLSGEGIRWLMGQMSDCMATPLLVWILLLGMGIAAVRQSGLLDVFKPGSPKPDRIALLSVVVLFIVLVVVLLLLTAVPHAIMLSATGSLFPSPFSAALVPMIALGMCLLGMVYGVLSGRFASLTDLYEVLVSGIRSCAVVLLFYLLLSQLYFTVTFAFLS